MTTAIAAFGSNLADAARKPLPTIALLFIAAMFAVAFSAGAAGVTGVALLPAFNTFNDLVNGYGKQILTLMGFTVAAIGYIATNATAVVFKFVGYAMFLGVGLAAAVALVGATV